MLPVGHTMGVWAAHFSPDGKRIITSSPDHTVKIWDVSTGYLIVDFRQHKYQVNDAIFSPDGTKVVSTSGIGEIKIWDSFTGEILFDLLDEHLSWITCVAFSKDGSKIITGNMDGYLRIINTITGITIINSKIHTSQINSICYSNDCKFILTASDDNSVKLLNSSSGEIVLKITSPEEYSSFKDAQISPLNDLIITASTDSTVGVYSIETGSVVKRFQGYNAGVNTASFSPDQRFVVTTSDDSTVKVWDIAKEHIILNLIEHTDFTINAKFSLDGKSIITTSKDGNLRVWDFKNGIAKYEIGGSENGFPTIGEISPNGQLLLTASEYSSIIKVLELNSGKLLASMKRNSLADAINSVVFSPDDGKIAISLNNETAQIWDVQTGKIEKSFNGHISSVMDAQFSPDGRLLATCSFDKSIRIWDIRSGKLYHVFKEKRIGQNKIKFAPDGNLLVSYGPDFINIWDVIKGKLKIKIKRNNTFPLSICISQNSRLLFVNYLFSDDIRVFNLETGKLHFAYRNSCQKNICDLIVSRDGRIMLIKNGENVEVRNTATNKLLCILKDKQFHIQKAVFSPDGNKIITTSTQNFLWIWNANDGSVLYKDTSNTIGYSYARIGVTNDGAKIIIVRNNIVDVRNIDNGLLLSSFKIDELGQLGNIDLQDLRKNYLLSYSNNAVTINNLNTDKLPYSFIILENGEYLVYNETGWYDGTSEARKLLYFTCGTELIELDQVKDQLWVPNLAERIMKGEIINAKTLDELDICGLIPKTEELNDSPGQCHFRITPSRGGLGPTVLYVNGKEMKRFQSEQLTKKGSSYELIISEQEYLPWFIPGEENSIGIKAYTAINEISSRGVSKIIKDSRSNQPPNLYGVMIGVSDYKGEEMDLQYAAKDAQDISRIVKTVARKWLNADGKEHVFMYDLTTGSNRYQMPEKKGIQRLLEEIGRKAGPNDILMLFFAGHGAMVGEGAHKQFYFLTADASVLSQEAAIKDAGISTEELTEWIKPQNIKAQKRILIFDACNSGQAINDIVKLGKIGPAARNDDQARLIKALDRLNEKSGLMILAASASDQSAYEMNKYSQGLLSYCLLKTLKEKPDILSEGKYLDVSRWFNAARDDLSILNQETGARQEPQFTSTTNFNIGIVDKEVIDSIQLPQEKVLFIGSNFQNGDLKIADDDFAFTKLVNHALNSWPNNGKIQYMAESESPDAYSLIGRYFVNGNDLKVIITLKHGKIVISKFEMLGSRSRLEEISNKIVDKAITIMNRL